MNQGMKNTVISAVVGGIVGAAVVFFASGKGDMKNLDVESLTVERLTVTEHASLLNKEGKEEVAIREGSVFAENLIIGKKFIGNQFQAHAMVANRVYATPDNLFTTPMDQWRFFAELGASKEAGGELVVRSVTGPAQVNRQTNQGALFRMGFDTESRPQMVGIHNPDRRTLPISTELSERQQQMIANAMASSGTPTPNPNFSGASVPLGGGYQSSEVLQPSIATQPDPNNPMR